MLSQSVDGNPVIAVISRRVGEKADTIRRDSPAISPFFEERFQLCFYQGAGAMTGVFGNHENRRRALRLEKTRLTLGRKTFLGELFSNPDRRFQLTARRRSRLRPGNGSNLRIVVAIVRGE